MVTRAPQGIFVPPRTVNFVVAASDSSARSKAQADDVCTGIADDVQIQAALDSERSVFLRRGNYATTGSITMREKQELTFEDGAIITYSGSGAALNFESSSPPFSTYRLVIRRPQIICTTPGATGIDMSKTFQSTVYEPFIYADIAIDIYDANTLYIIGGGVLECRPGATRPAGSVGIRLSKSQTTTPANNILIAVNQISKFDIGIELGSTDFTVSCVSVTFQQVYIAACNTAVLIHRASLLKFDGGWSESNVDYVFHCDNTTANVNLRPFGLIIDNFSAYDPAAAYFFKSDDYYYAIDFRCITNGRPIYFGDHTTGEMDISGHWPTITKNNSDVKYKGSTEWSGAYVRRAYNYGRITLNGTGSQTDFLYNLHNLVHGNEASDYHALVTPTSEDASGQFYITVNHYYINIHYLVAPPHGIGNVTLDWRAWIQ